MIRSEFHCGTTTRTLCIHCDRRQGGKGSRHVGGLLQKAERKAGAEDIGKTTDRLQVDLEENGESRDYMRTI
jgi:hypothetical protein